MVDLKNEVWYQKCHDPICKAENFRSDRELLNVTFTTKWRRDACVNQFYSFPSRFSFTCWNMPPVSPQRGKRSLQLPPDWWVLGAAWEAASSAHRCRLLHAVGRRAVLFTSATTCFCAAPSPLPRPCVSKVCFALQSIRNTHLCVSLNQICRKDF